MHERTPTIEPYAGEPKSDNELLKPVKQRTEAAAPQGPSSTEESEQATKKPTAGTETFPALPSTHDVFSAASTEPKQKPVSQRVLDRNRRNALKSSGPKSEQGKRRSRRNATKHGICSRTEDSEEFQTLYSALCRDYEPVGAAQELVVRHMTHCWLQLARVRRFEEETTRRAAQSAAGTPLPSTLPDLMELLSIMQFVEAEPQNDSEIESAGFAGMDRARRQQLAFVNWLARRSQAGVLGLPQQAGEESNSEIGSADLPLAHDLERVDRYEKGALRKLAFFTDLLDRMQRQRKNRKEEAIDVPESL